jgi:hypothetical protein
MKEATIFEAWADRLVEGTWSTPDTPEKQAKLADLLSKELIVGADATNATEQLYDLIGDDELFDQLQALADQDANADARDLVYERLQELADRDPDINAVLQAIGADTGAEEDGISGMGMTKDEYFKKYPDSPAPENPNNKLAESALRSMRQAAGLIESRLMDDTGETIDHILNRFKHEVKKFEQGGELADDLYHALFDYYFDQGEIPYGIAKARDGDPYDWVAANLESHLSGGGIVGGNPDEDYGIERESVEHGDYAEESQDPLSSILKSAGVPAEVTPAPDYMTGDMEEGMIGGALGAVAGGLVGGPIGAVRGASIGSSIGDVISPEETDGGHEMYPPELDSDVEESSPLAGQYGHPGKMKAVSKDLSFLDRLKELSGMKK